MVQIGGAAPPAAADATKSLGGMFDFISRRGEKPVADCNHLEPHRHLLQTQASTVHWGVKK